MATASAPSENPTSLVGVTLRRSFTMGRFFLGYGVVVASILAVSLGFSGGTAFSSAFPLLVPIFGAVGSLGALTVFSSDRLKGVLEYLMAYGITPRRLFLQTILATVVLVTIVVGVSLGVGIGIYVARGHSVSSDLALAIVAYGVPMSYASAAFATTVGMYWTALSSPRSGMNSPIGLAPLFGILPPVLTLMLIGVAAGTGWVSSTAGLDLLALAAVAVTAAVVLLLVGLIGRLLLRERLLSPA